VAFAGPALPSLVSYRSGVDAELLRHQDHERERDFGHIRKPPIRSKEKQQDGKCQSIGSALIGAPVNNDDEGLYQRSNDGLYEGVISPVANPVTLRE
jgi:hypothetical protein